METSGLLRAEAPILPHATSHVGDPQVRHRGTIGGSIAHGDPASDLPAVLLALGATLVVQGPDGTREIAADDFFTGFLETALGETELLTEIRVPKVAGAGLVVPEVQPPGPGLGHRRGRVRPPERVRRHRPGQHGLPPGARLRRPRPPSRPGASVEDAAAVADEGVDPAADLNASVEYRRHLARVLTRRALDEASD